MGAQHALRPAGCTCPWAQIHMDMPWQKLSTAADCPVHTHNPPREHEIVGYGPSGQPIARQEIYGEWLD